jgi:hypothetical protein
MNRAEGGLNSMKSICRFPNPRSFPKGERVAGIRRKRRHYRFRRTAATHIDIFRILGLSVSGKVPTDGAAMFEAPGLKFHG